MKAPHLRAGTQSARDGVIGKPPPFPSIEESNQRVAPLVIVLCLLQEMGVDPDGAAASVGLEMGALDSTERRGPQS
jgi:hypothetical protein